MFQVLLTIFKLIPLNLSYFKWVSNYTHVVLLLLLLLLQEVLIEVTVFDFLVVPVVVFILLHLSTLVEDSTNKQIKLIL